MRLLFCVLMAFTPVVSGGLDTIPIWTIVSSAKPMPLNEAADLLKASNFRDPATSTILVIWASWCEYCKYELRQLNQYLADNKNADIRVIGISVDDKANVAKARAVGTELSLTFPLFHTGSDAIKMKGKVEKLPTTFVLNRKKEVDGIYTGITDERLHLILKRATSLARLLSD
jgi:thiol-disulfide isomerase/thioredoxin